MNNSAEIKKQWLISLVLLALVTSFNFIAKMPSSTPYVTILFALIIPYIVIYYFSYEKSGTKLLAFQMITMPFGFLFQIYSAMRGGISAGVLLELVTVLLVSLLYVFRSYRLYQLNKAAKQ